MKRIISTAVIIAVLFALFACKKDDKIPEQLKSPVTDGDMLCVCAEYDTDVNVLQKVSEAGYATVDFDTGSLNENTRTLIRTDDSDAFIYEFDDAYLAEKAYHAILFGADSEDTTHQPVTGYPANFAVLAGSLVRFGNYVVNDTLKETGTGELLRGIYELCGVEVPAAQPQKGFEERIMKSGYDVKQKALLREFKVNGFLTSELPVSQHGAIQSYLILEDNGIIAGRLDVTTLAGNEIETFYSEVTSLYNERIGAVINDNGFVLFTWYRDCADVLMNTVDVGSDNA